MSPQFNFLSLLIALGFYSLPFFGSSSENGGDLSKNVIFFESIEDSTPFSEAHSLEIGSWNYALEYVTSPVFRGKRSARFEIREDQPLVKSGKRSEATIIKGIPDRDMWYSYAVYFPAKDFVKDSEREVITQWYQDGSPATSVRVKDDILLLETGNERSNRVRINIMPLAKDKWHELVFHFIHSNKSDGLVEVWLNGNKVITHKGGNMYDDVLPKWKIGLYKSAFKYGTSSTDHRVIFFDNIKVGNQYATYAEMVPANY